VGLFSAASALADIRAPDSTPASTAILDRGEGDARFFSIQVATWNQSAAINVSVMFVEAFSTTTRVFGCALPAWASSPQPSGRLYRRPFFCALGGSA
jgi:hypothetical protein